tara:strand:+ start:1069 stop:1473 length:405 start_codon:yes stop_codon:yes gene_type:complete
MEFKLRVQFYKKMFNGEMRDFARIPVTDTRDILETPVRASDIKRFPKEWAEYQKNKDKTPVKKTIHLPGLHEDHRIELELKGIKTVKDLASAKTTVLQGMGKIYVTMQEIAKLQVKADEKTKSSSKKSEEKKEE